MELLPNLVGPIDAQVGLPDPLDLGNQPLITQRPPAATGRITPLRRMLPITRRGDLQHLADRLDPEVLPVFVDERPHGLSRRSSSAWAKNALASFRISLARRSSFTSRSSALMR